MAFIPYPAGNSLTIDLQTTAALSPGSILFSPTPLTASATETATVSKLGSAPLTITDVAISGTAEAEYAIAADACLGATIPVHGQCTISVSFSPSESGTQTALLTVTDSAVVGKQTTVIEGTGTPISIRRPPSILGMSHSEASALRR